MEAETDAISEGSSACMCSACTVTTPVESEGFRAWKARRARRALKRHKLHIRNGRTLGAAIARETARRLLERSQSSQERKDKDAQHVIYL